MTTIGEVDPSLAIGADGRVVAGTSSGRVYAWTSSGALLANWGYPLTTARISAPVIDALNNVYVGTANGLAFSLAPNPPGMLAGHINWQKTLGGSRSGAPLLLNGEKAVFVSTSGKLTVLNALSGDLWWENVTSGAIHASPNISHDGRVYITTAASKVHAIPAGARVLMNPDPAACPWPMQGRQRSHSGTERQWTQEGWVVPPANASIESWFDFCECDGAYVGTVSACYVIGGKYGQALGLSARAEHSADLSVWTPRHIHPYANTPNFCTDKPPGWATFCDRSLLIDPPANTYGVRYTRLRANDPRSAS